MKFSFDFDNTLSRDSVKKIAKQLIELGHELHVVTSRYENYSIIGKFTDTGNYNGDLFIVTNHLGIKKEHVHFMNMELKSDFFKEEKDFVFHLDDCNIEIEFINNETEVRGILCDYGQSWQKELLELLKSLGIDIKITA